MKMKKTKILGLVLALIMFFTNLPFGSGIVHAEGEDDVEINLDNFPDAKFREYINDNIDKDGNGSLSKAEREAVTQIKVGRTDYNDTQYDNLVGLKYFPNLQTLICFDNDMDELNLSENTELTYLDCSQNNLRNTLDLSKNKKLKTLICRNNKIETLNLENNAALKKLEFTNNRVKNLDLSKNTNLIELVCENNNLESLDLINNTKLKILNFKLNGIKNPDLSSNLELSELNCQQNSNLGKLDLSSNKKLTKLDCFFCGLTELKLADNNELKELKCNGNQLTELDLSTSPKLTYVKCQANKLKKLDLSKNLELDDFNCSENQLTSLDLSKNTKLNTFTGYLQNYTVTLAPGAEYIKASDLPEGIDFTKVISKSNINSVETDSFKLKANAKYIEYEYNTGNNDKKLGVKINIIHYNKMIVLKDPDLIYTEGDKLDLSKLEVQLEDDEGNKIVVPFSKFQYYNIRTNIADKTELVRTEHNEQPIKIKLESLNAETNKLTVNERKFNPNNVVKLKVKTQPVKLEYTEGDKLNLAGLEVTLIDNFGKEKDVALADFDDYQITTDPADNIALTLEKNATAIIVKKGNATDATNTLKVEEKAFDPDHVKSITVKEQPTKLEYTEGQNLDLTGLEVTLTDDFGKIKDVAFKDFDTYQIKATPANGTALTVVAHNGRPVALTKGNLEPAKTENLTVNARVFDPDRVESIKVTKEPDKIIYTEGDNLVLTGLVVTLTDNQGTTKEVLFANFETYDLVATPANETALTVADHNGKTVKITKGNLSAETKALTVNSKDFDLNNVEKIEVLEQPSNLIYTEGENLNLAGLKVKLTDNKGNVKEVSFEKFEANGIKTDPANDADLKVADNGKTVTITKGKGRAETDPLTVNPKVFDSQNIAKIEVKTQPKLDYTEDDKLNLSELVVTLTDNHGLKEDVAFENFAQYGLTAIPSNNTTLAVSDDGKKIIITKDNLPPAETNALTVKAKENPPTPTDPKIIGPVDPNAPGTTVSNPNEYWTVTFVSEDTNKGTVDAANTFYIPMTENKKLSDLKAPAVKAKPGFEFYKWDTALNTNIDKNLTVKAIFKAKGNTPNPPKPQDPDQEARDYWIIRFISDNPYGGYIGYSDTVRIEKNRGYRIEDLARLAPEAIPYSGYEFAGWSPYLYGNKAIINEDMDIYARFEEIYVPRYSYERRRPRRIDDDRDDRDDSKEEKPVEVNEYDKLEAILFINDSIMQKSVNGVVSQVRMDIAPFIYQSRTMLPIRFVAEALGFMVTWDANTRTVYLVDKENIVQIPVDTNNIIVNGKAFVSDVKPMIKNNRTMLPVANVARALGLQDGKDILWDAAMKFVTLRRNVLK
ncbi:stalk domain-containing protein [uncultured Fenollaria sp.]|uniref:stalk domain-containing protein n=1 Tax=uncultured Fenollaria sp. TaxID=1686315 RepID=UPI0025D38F92|nr:bacterial Ig-like domain-containing protein [uncultured Fenollaria sp.]